MSHKNLINGTAYDTSGGKCLVNGTSYDISKGRTLINSIGYDINFKSEILSGAIYLNSVLTTVYDIAYGNGYYVAAGTYKSYCALAYTTDPSSGWTRINCSGSGTSTPNGMRSIIYANEYFVALGSYYGQKHTVVIYYTKDPSSGWSSKVLWTNSSGASAGNIIYDGQNFIAVGDDYLYDDEDEAIGTCTRICCINSFETSWSSTTNSYYPYDTTGEIGGNSYIMYNGTYYVITQRRYTKSSARLNCNIVYSTSLDGSWTLKTLWYRSTGGTTYYTQFYGADYINNTFIMYGTSGGLSYATYAMLAYGTTPAGISSKTLWTESDNTPKFNRIYGATYLNGVWFITGSYDNGSTVVERIAFGNNFNSLTYADFWETETNNNNMTYIGCKAVNDILFVFPCYDAGDDHEVTTEGQYLAWGGTASDIVSELENC